MSRSLRPALLAATSCNVVVFAAAMAYAQEAPTRPAQAKKPVQVEEVVVTARRSRENIQSVPVTIKPFSAANLRQQSIESSEDLQLATPGVFLSGAGGRQSVNYTIRGQSKALAGLTSPAVVSYFAEVPDPVQGSGLAQYDVSSIQVLKGPQGTLFGRNTTGGALLVYPIAPTDVTTGYIDQTFGNYGDKETQGALNVPVIKDMLDVRVAGDLHFRDGYTKEIGAGSDLNNIDSHAYRASVIFKPTSYIKNTTILDSYQNNDDGQDAVLSMVDPNFDPLDELGLRTPVQQQLAAQQARGPFVEDNSVPQYTRVRRKSIINRTEVQLGDGISVTNIFGYRDTHLDYLTQTADTPILYADGTGLFPKGTPVEYLTAGTINNTHQFSDEVQVKGAAFNQKLNWLLGGFFLRSDPSGANGFTVNAFQIVGTPPATSGYAFLTEKSKALFANVSYDLGTWLPGLKLDGGFRYTWDAETACSGSGLDGSLEEVNPKGCVASNPLLSNVSVNATSSKAPTWTVGIDYQATPKLFMYVASRHGYRSGGINAPTLGGRLLSYQSFNPETVTDVEIGARSNVQLTEQATLRLNASAYTGYYDDVQTALTGLRTNPGCNPASTTNPPGISPDGDCNPNNDPSGTTLIANIGKSRVAGIDVDGTLTPVANLHINFGASFVATKTLALEIPAALAFYNPTSGGIPFRNTPKSSFTVGVTYVYPMDGRLGTLLFSGNFYDTSSIPYPGNTLPAYNVTNARIDWDHVFGSGFEASLFGRNLFDAKYAASGNLSTNSIYILTETYGAPRTYGVELRYSF